MTYDQKLTLSLYLQIQKNYQGKFWIIEIEYCFLIEESFWSILGHAIGVAILLINKLDEKLAALMETLNNIWTNQCLYTIYFLEKQPNFWDIILYVHRNNLFHQKMDVGLHEKIVINYL